MKAVKNLGNKLSGNKYSDNLLGTSLEDLCRQATNKRLPGPDEEANKMVVEAINTGVAGPNASQQVLAACRKRLTMANPHKQWLAVVLVQKILQDCEEAVAPVRSDIMAEVGKIAAKPMNRYGSDLQSQQQAKSAAFNLLRTYGREGQEVLRGVAGLGRTNFTASSGGGGVAAISPTEPNEPRSWPKLAERVQTGIAMATSHNEMLQDMLLNMSAEQEGTSSDTTFELGFLKDLVGEMLAFRRAFEQLLAQLSTFETDEAQQLMMKALEVMDMMNNTLVLQEEVTKAKESPRSPAGAGSPTSTAVSSRHAYGSSPASTFQHEGASERPYAASPAVSNVGFRGSPVSSLPSPGMGTPQPSGPPSLLGGGAFDLQSPPAGKPTPIPMSSSRASNNPFAAPPPSPATPYGVSPMQLSSMPLPNHQGGSYPSSPSYGNQPQRRPASYPSVSQAGSAPSSLSIPPPFKLDSSLVGSAGSSPTAYAGLSQHAQQQQASRFTSQQNPVYQHTPPAQPAQQQQQPDGPASPPAAKAQTGGQEHDAEWDMFFKDRVASPTSASSQQHTQQATSDAFDELLSKR
ncbi:hypothetical protein WJX72_010005 [[Myrmecia] bisecta]|uniref:VHS domain-containing protein n=1 Tax=[Myrmecia] bisecta TaxID=41462 RepID=A0AAW1PPM7_9CHLO